MRLSRQSLFVLAGFLCAVPWLSAQSESDRQLSEQITNAVSSSFSYNDPAKAPEKASEVHPVIVQPERKNRIIRLPRVVVEGERPPVFREQDIYSPEALKEIAMKRYFSDFARALNRFKIPIIGGAAEAWAMARYREEESRKVWREIGEQIQVDKLIGEAARAAEMQTILQEYYIRPGSEMHPGQVNLRDARGQ